QEVAINLAGKTSSCAKGGSDQGAARKIGRLPKNSTYVKQAGPDGRIAREVAVYRSPVQLRGPFVLRGCVGGLLRRFLKRSMSASQCQQARAAHGRRGGSRGDLIAPTPLGRLGAAEPRIDAGEGQVHGQTVASADPKRQGRKLCIRVVAV